MRGILRPLEVWDFAKAYLDAFSFLRTRDSGTEAITVVSQVPVDAAGVLDVVAIHKFPNCGEEAQTRFFLCRFF